MKGRGDTKHGSAGCDGRSRFSQIPTRWSVLKGPPRRALDYLFRTYGRAILSYTWGRLGRGDFHPLAKSDCEDLFQDFFLRLGQGEWLAKPDPARGRFRPFFIKRLEFFLREKRSAAISRLRARGQTLDLDPLPEPSVPDPLEDRLEKEWKHATYVEALDRLGARNAVWRDVLQTHFESREKDEVMARKMGRSLQSYRSLLKRAKAALRTIYAVVDTQLDGFGGVEF